MVGKITILFALIICCISCKEDFDFNLEQNREIYEKSVEEILKYTPKEFDSYYIRRLESHKDAFPNSLIILQDFDIECIAKYKDCIMFKHQKKSSPFLRKEDVLLYQYTDSIMLYINTLEIDTIYDNKWSKGYIEDALF